MTECGAWGADPYKKQKTPGAVDDIGMLAWIIHVMLFSLGNPRQA